MQAHAIIRALGGATAVSAALGIKRSAVSMWGSAGIPAKYWPALLRLTAERPEIGLTMDVLEHHSSNARRSAAPSEASAA